MLLLDFSITHYSTGFLIPPSNLNRLRTFKEIIPFEGLPRVLLAQYFISQFSLQLPHSFKAGTFNLRGSFLKTGRFVICGYNFSKPPPPGGGVRLGPEWDSGDSCRKGAVTQR